MFNYIRTDQPIKKPVLKKAMTPIETEVSMPIEMQPVPQMDPKVTCTYLDMNMPPSPQPSTPTPIPLPPHTPLPCMPCTYCGMPYHHFAPCMYGHTSSPDPSCDMSKNQDDMEVLYIKKMYPPLCKKIQKYIDSQLNQYDHDLSPIYEMYPSSETIDHMANCIYTDMKADMSNLIKEFEGNPNTRSPMGGSFYTLVYVMLLNELYRKRMRRRLYR